MKTLHGRIDRVVEVTVRIVESNKQFKIKATPQTRLQTIANNLADLLDLDPLCTQWAFFPDSASIYEFPVSYTVHQIKPNAYNLSLLAKVMTTTMVKDYFLEKDLPVRVFKAQWTGQARAATRSEATQTEPPNRTFGGRMQDADMPVTDPWGVTLSSMFVD